MFYPPWCQLHNRTCDPHPWRTDVNWRGKVQRLLPGIHTEKPNLILPFAAYELGFDTVQFQRGFGSAPEMVATGDLAMVRPGCNLTRPVPAHEYKMRMAVSCSPGPSACSGGIEIRTGL